MKKNKGLSSKSGHQPSESLLDEAGDESFPASDPLAWNLGSNPTHHLQGKDEIAHLLAKEHQLIKKVINIITILIKDLSARQIINMEALKQLGHFFQHFVEQTHHKKEALLYECLNKQKEKNKTSAYLLKDLLHEHEFGNELLSRLHTLSLSLSSSSQKDKNMIEKTIRLLNDMHHFYLTHIQKEEEYILPHIRDAIDETMQKNLLSQFEKIDQPVNLEKYKLLLELTDETV